MAYDFQLGNSAVLGSILELKRKENLK